MQLNMPGEKAAPEHALPRPGTASSSTELTLNPTTCGITDDADALGPTALLERMNDAVHPVSRHCKRVGFILDAFIGVKQGRVVGGSYFQRNGLGPVSTLRASMVSKGMGIRLPIFRSPPARFSPRGTSSENPVRKTIQRH